MKISVIIAILVIHWLADFVAQTDYQALNKSRNSVEGFAALLFHAACYTSVCVVGFVLISYYWGFGSIVISSKTMLNYLFFLLTSHFAIDFCTSRLNGYLWRRELRHWFFVSIGFDQIVHYAVLFWVII